MTFLSIFAKKSIIMKRPDIMTTVSLLVILGMAGACSDNNSGDADSRPAVFNDSANTTQIVKIMELQPSPFSHDIVSNGRVRARQVADVYFRSADIVSEVLVHNGQQVAAGQPLARLDLFKLNAEKQKQAAALEQAKLEMQDVLIGQGYDPSAANIPADVIRLARVRSGLEQAEAAYSAVIKDIDNATIKAPFAGVVANMKLQRHSMAPTNEPACRVINNGSMDIEFPILESELALVSVGDAADVTPFSGGGTTHGRISEINPIIDENGHVTVKASLESPHGLVDGMNARIRIRRDLSERLSVPKTAVVLRSGRQVVFTYEDGMAMWNYVTTGLENLDSYEITEGLHAGQTVIVSGNENLAHESPVETED